MAQDPYSSFSEGFMSGYKMTSDIKEKREAKSKLSATLLLDGYDDYRELKKEREDFLELSKQLVKDFDLNTDGSNAALNAVYGLFEANRNTKNPYEAVKKQIEEDGIRGFSMPEEKKEDIDSQTKTALGIVTEDKKVVEPQIENVSGIQEVQINKKEKKKNNFLSKIFDTSGKINERAMELVLQKVGSKQGVAEYLSYQKDGTLPALDGIDPTLTYDILYQTKLGKGYSLAEFNAMDINSTNALIASFQDNPEALEVLIKRKDELVEAKLISDGQLGQNSEAVLNIAKTDYLRDAGLIDENFKSVRRDGESYTDYVKRYNEATQSYDESPIGQLFSSVSSESTAIAAITKLNSLKENNVISLDSYKTHKKLLDDSLEKYKNTGRREKFNPEDFKKVVLVRPEDNQYIGQGVRNSVTNEIKLDSGQVVVGNTINGRSMLYLDQEGGDEVISFGQADYKAFVEEIGGEKGKDLDQKKSGLNDVVDKFDKMLYILENDPKNVISTKAGAISQALLSGSKVIDFFVREVTAGKYKPTLEDLKRFASSEGASRYTDEESQGILTSLLSDNIVNLAGDSARFASYQIQAAYSLARALGQEGKGLSDKDVMFQLKSLMAPGANKDTIRGQLYGITNMLYNGIESERKIFHEQMSKRHPPRLSEISPYKSEKWMTSGMIVSNKNFIQIARESGEEIKRSSVEKRSTGKIDRSNYDLENPDSDIARKEYERYRKDKGYN
jgi:hypothetical protein